MRWLCRASLLVGLAGCGNGPARIPPDARAFLEEQAGVLAPVMTLPESLAGPGPDLAEVDELLRLCDGNPVLYVYFYDCLTESIGVLQAPPSAAATGAPDSAATSPAGRGATDPSTL